jgi:hypothetical protein
VGLDAAARTAAAIIIGALLVAPHAHAQDGDWRPIERACDQYAEGSFCQGKAGCPNWQWLSACIVQQRGNITSRTQVQLDACIDAVARQRQRQRACALCGDPVADVMNCMTGQGS